MTDTLVNILAIKFDGNFAADADKFERIDRFCARRDVTPQERHAASYHASKEGMGEHFDTLATDPYFADPDNFGYT